MELPASIDVEEFLAARKAETISLLDELKNRKKGKRSFQQLHFELRRRAQSHNPYRIPRRCRATILRDFAVNPPVASRRPRRDRRRPKNLRREFESRVGKAAWLETHLWHVKRMHMTSRWGYRLASSPTQKCQRKIFRLSRRRAVFHDRSYHTTVELRGRVEDLADLLQALGGNRSLAVRPAGSFVLFQDDQLLGPCETLSAKRLGAAERILWLTVHPTLLSALQTLLETFWKGPPTCTVPIGCFELIGPQSLRHVARVLGSEGFHFLSSDTQCLLASAHPATYLLHLNRVLSVDIAQPEILGPFPPRAPHMPLNVDPPRPLCIPEPDDQSGVFQWELLGDIDPDAQKYRLTRRSKRRKGGRELYNKISRPQTRLATNPLTDSSSIIDLTMPEPKSARTVDQVDTKANIVEPSSIVLRRVGRNTPRVQLLFRRGTIGRDLWTLLWRQGVRAVGTTNLNSIYRENQELLFPDHWWLSPAGAIEAQSFAIDEKALWLRRPPSKRVNYSALGLPFPFDFPLTVLPQLAGRMLCSRDIPQCALQLLSVLKSEAESVDTQEELWLPVVVEAVARGRCERYSFVYTPEGEPMGFIVIGGHSLASGQGAGLGYIRWRGFLKCLSCQKANRLKVLHRLGLEVPPTMLLTVARQRDLISVNVDLKGPNQPLYKAKARISLMY